MNIGPFKITWSKSYSQLVSILNREKGVVDAIALKTQPHDQLASYRSWVYACVSLISDRIASLPYYFYNIDTEEELSTSNKGYRVFTKPFKQPNELMSFRFIKNFCQIQLDLCGMACIYKARNQLGQVWELWPLNMNDFLKVEASNSFYNPTVRYFFKSGAGFVDFDRSELIILGYPHPTNMWSGMSPIQSQAYASDIDSYIEVYERDFFKNSARVDFALTTDLAIDQPKADEIKARWTEKFRGRFHDVAVLDSGLKPIPLKYTNRDFEFLHLAGWSKEKVLGAYKVPANKLGSTESNRAGSVYTDISFNRESIQPRITLWDEELTQNVLATFDSRIKVMHENPIPRDRQLEVQEAKAYVGVPTLTIDEYRSWFHKLPPVEGGNQILIPSGFVLLKDLKKISALAAKPQPKPNQVDRDRDDETPHTNPDGSDDRDDNPTDGRAYSADLHSTSECLADGEEKAITCSLDEFERPMKGVRAVWNDALFNTFSKMKAENINEAQTGDLFLEYTKITIDVLLESFGAKTVVKEKALSDNWIALIASKASNEYITTLFKSTKWQDMEWKDYFVEEFDTNPRLSKIINSLSRSCINFVKFMIISDQNGTMCWNVNSNECGHRGRIKEITTQEQFEIGGKKMRFPGEVMNFMCDCSITLEGEK